MAFQAGIPQPGDLLSNSQGDILANFTQLNNQFSINHVALTAGTDNGKHTFVTLMENGGAPATAVGEGSIYVDVSGGTREQLYYRRENNGVSAPITTLIGGYAKITRATGAYTGNNFNMGAAAVVGGGGTTIDVTFTNPLIDANYLVLSMKDAGESFAFENVTANGFRLRTSDVAYTFAMVHVIGEIA